MLGLVSPYLMIKTFVCFFSFFPKCQGEDWMFVRVLCHPIGWGVRTSLWRDWRSALWFPIRTGHVMGSLCFLVRSRIRTGHVTWGYWFQARNLVKTGHVMRSYWFLVILGHVTRSYWFVVKNLVRTGHVMGSYCFLVRTGHVTGSKLKLLFSR